MIKVTILLILPLLIQGCGKNGLENQQPANTQSITNDETLRCLEPYDGPSKGRFSQNQQDLFVTANWDRAKQIRGEKLELGKTLYAIRMTDVGGSYTGRCGVYRDSDVGSKFIGYVAECRELRYDFPSLRLLPETDWLVSRETVMSGTGIYQDWSRFWEIKGDAIYERLAVPISGKCEMSTGQPWRRFDLEPIPSESSATELAFTFKATCELIHVPEGSDDGVTVVLPEIRRRIIFEPASTGWLVLNTRKSDLSLREFQILTDVQLAVGAEFWQVYGDDFEKMLRTDQGKSLRAWLANNDISVASMPDRIQAVLTPE